MSKVYRITLVGKFNYPLRFTGTVLKNMPDRMIVDVNGENHQLEVYKEDIIYFELLNIK